MMKNEKGIETPDLSKTTELRCVRMVCAVNKTYSGKRERYHSV
jgi:hypothetical protein